jgi:colicin import membrane protein
VIESKALIERRGVAMSTIQDPWPTITGEPEADPFRYGWRYVKVTRPDGTTDFDQVPLTLEDTLYPQEEDFLVNSHGHDEDRHYLKAVLKARLAGDPSAVVLSDCRVAFVPELQPVGPDIVVFIGVHERRNWGTFDAAQEGATPVLVIEVVSPDYRNHDVTAKVDYYRRAGVPLYVIVDDLGRGAERRLRLAGYRLTADGYEPLESDEQGRLWLEPVRLWLGVVGDRVVCYNPDTGQEIGDYTAVVRARAEAETRAAEAAARAAEAAARAAEAEDRARIEAAARVDLQARLQEMEAELRRLRGEA